MDFVKIDKKKEKFRVTMEKKYFVSMPNFFGCRNKVLFKNKVLHLYRTPTIWLMNV